MRNVPYVIIRNEQGEITNPIVGYYESGKSIRSWKRSFGKRPKNNCRKAARGRQIQQVPLFESMMIGEVKVKRFTGKFKQIRHSVFAQ